jgi:tRNA modification GTPase
LKLEAGATIVALSSPAGGAERAVIRLSGPEALRLADRIAPGTRARGVRQRTGRLGPTSFPVAVWSMPAPRSYTREDVAELHVPGSPPLARAVMDRLLDLGARAAEPGEFTRRAFVNGRIDLAQAEAVLAVIRAGSDAELSAAAAILEGAFSRKVADLEDRLASFCADLEASIDFVDQDLEILPADEGLRRLAELREGLAALLSESRAAEIAADRPTAFLVGPPNAGKSTLFNALTGADAITSDVPGTTRDCLEGRAESWRLFDAPGLLAGEGRTALDGEASRRAREAADHADLWIVVVDGTAPRVARRPPAGRPALAVVTKADVADAESVLPTLPIPDGVAVSALTGRGMEDLRARLRDWSGAAGPGARFALSRRQLALLRQARRMLDRTAEALRGGRGVELVALDARAALESFGGITGHRVDEEILDRIFTRFCVGK